MNGANKNKLILLYGILILVYVFVLHEMSIKVTNGSYSGLPKLTSNVTETKRLGNNTLHFDFSPQPIRLPFAKVGTTQTEKEWVDNYLFQFDFSSEYVRAGGVRISSNSSITHIWINGEALNFSSDLKNSHGLQSVILSRDTLRTGVNHVAVKIQPAPQSARIKFYVGNAWYGKYFIENSLGSLLVGLVFLLLVRTPLGRSVLSGPIIAVLAVSTAVILTYEFSHDYSYYDIGHLDYLYSVFSNHVIPNVYSSFQSYQPPLYYLSAVPFMWLANWAGGLDYMAIVPYWGHACYLIFFLYCIASARLLVKWEPALFLAALLIAFWPSGFRFGTLVSNDVLNYPIMAAVVFYLLQWQKNNHVKHLWIALALAFISIAVKSSGLLNLLIIAGLIVWRVIFERFPLRFMLPPPHIILIFTVILVTSVSVNFGRRLTDATDHSTPVHFLFYNTPVEATEKSWQQNKGEFLSHIMFGLNIPVLFSGVKTPIMRYFWNDSLRAALMLPGTYNPVLCVLSISTFMIVLFYMLISSLALAIVKRENIRGGAYWFAPVFIVLISILMMMYIKMYFPTGNSLRYFYPIIAWIMILFARNLEWHHAEKRTLALSMGLFPGYSLAAFCIATSVYMAIN